MVSLKVSHSHLLSVLVLQEAQQRRPSIVQPPKQGILQRGMKAPRAGAGLESAAEQRTQTKRRATNRYSESLSAVCAEWDARLAASVWHGQEHSVAMCKQPHQGRAGERW